MKRYDWEVLANKLGFTQHEITQIQNMYADDTTNRVNMFLFSTSEALIWLEEMFTSGDFFVLETKCLYNY